MKELAGKRIVDIYLSPDKENITFKTTDKKKPVYHYVTIPDCCNHVYIHHITGIEALFDGIIANVLHKSWMEDDIHEEEEDGNCESETCIITLTTDKGRCDLEIRNDHNGSYGGEVHYAPEFNEIPRMASLVLEDF